MKVCRLLSKGSLIVYISHIFRIDPVQEAEFSEYLLGFFPYLRIICIYLFLNLRSKAVSCDKCALDKHGYDKCVEGELCFDLIV